MPRSGCLSPRAIPRQIRSAPISVHASAVTTLDLYAHMWPGDDDRIRQAVDRAFGPDAEDGLRTDREVQ